MSIIEGRRLLSFPRFHYAKESTSQKSKLSSQYNFEFHSEYIETIPVFNRDSLDQARPGSIIEYGMNMVKFFIIVWTLITTSLVVFASPQIPDYIVYGKDTVQTYNLILERYLQRHDTIKTDQLFGLSFRDGANFNCWRGYQAIYGIQNDSLFLVAIISCGELKNGKFNRSQSIDKISSIFGRRFENGKVFIDWFDGNISFPLSNKVLRCDGIFNTTFEKEKVLLISKGLLTKIEEVSNYVDSRNGIDRRDKEKIPDIIFKELKKKWKNQKEFDCSDKYVVTIDSNGYISEVKMRYSEQEIEKYYEMTEYKFCIDKLFKALRALKFDVIRDKGQPVSEDIYLEIWIDDNGKLENWTR
ncbi:hypothetical protein [Dyadobacter beijingensis]|uniref:hypothetical protein n=1 Tax=Dyadobacter beijingensis TaxID=365489 RepID=UPI00037F5E2E|nr:hypothetical protein [Dyadobacter beijingensis]